MPEFTLRLLLTLLFILPAWNVSGASYTSTKTDSTILIFVRHAEKEKDGTKDPGLNPDGLKRAEVLADSLSSCQLAAVYSTDYKRTKMTAAPSAEKFGLDIQIYGFDDINGFLTGLIEKYENKSVLIVGHSNTMPDFVNRVMGEKRFNQLGEEVYNQLFIVKTPKMGTGRVIQKTYYLEMSDQGKE